MNNIKQAKAALKINRIVIAALALCGIWFDPSIPEDLFTSAASLLWIWSSDAVRLEIKLINKIKGE